MVNVNRTIKKVNKIINKKNLGSSLTIYEYTQTSDAFGKKTNTLSDTIITSGARIDIDYGQMIRQGGTPLPSKTVVLLLPQSFVYDRAKYYKFLWMTDIYELDDDWITEIGQIQDINVVLQVKLKRVE